LTMVIMPGFSAARTGVAAGFVFSAKGVAAFQRPPS
jgi:hypothetical protein